MGCVERAGIIRPTGSGQEQPVEVGSKSIQRAATGYDQTLDMLIRRGELRRQVAALVSPYKDGKRDLIPL